jgi:hypothetical protein
MTVECRLFCDGEFCRNSATGPLGGRAYTTAAAARRENENWGGGRFEGKDLCNYCTDKRMLTVNDA